ncbi:hypothetical protein QYY28_002740 [Escherichia coli]|nr:hypothetical protein [Escherichia coli]
MVKKVACFFCKETEQRKDVEQKIITIIIFFTSKQLKTITYTHDDDDDKIKKMRLFPRPRRPVDVPTHQEDPQKSRIAPAV